MAAEKDMTVGDPQKIILNFTIPVFIGNVFQQVYSMADTVIVGKFVGTKALAAVGATGTINFLILGFLLGLTAGFTVLTAQKFGAGDMGSMRKTVGNAAILSFIVAVAMTLVSMLGMRWLLTFMNTPKDIFDDAYTYIMIICGGIFTQVLYNLLSSILRALGNSKTPLYFLLLSAGLNIVLDLVLIIYFHMGVAGAAYATVISQGVSGFLCLIFIIKKVPVLHMEKGEFRLEKNLSIQQLKVGFPMALQYSITAIGTMMVQSALNMLGSIAVAAFTAANKIENLLTQAFVAQGVTMATYCAQNMGAGRPDRIRKGFRAADMQGFLYGIGAGIFFIFAGKYLTYLFLSENVEEVIGNVEIYLRCIGIFMIPLAIVNIYRNGIQGMGYGLLPMMAGVAELVGRGATALVAAHYRSYFGTCMASPVAWILASALLLVMYHFIMKDLDQRFKSNVESAKNRL